MFWDKLPPVHIEDCRHRCVAEPESSDGNALCNLLAQSGMPPDQCGVQRDVCSACLRQFPPAADCWNTVIASLIYARSMRALESPARAPDVRANLVQLRDESRGRLALVERAKLNVESEPSNQPMADSLWDLLPPPTPRGRPRVKAWAVGVVTSPRRQATLDITLDSLMRAGWTAPYLFLDGTVRVQERFAQLPGVLREPRIGCWPNYYLALAELLMRQPDADAYLLAEDDARFYDAEVLREYLEQMLWPARRPCIVSLYCSSAISARGFGWQPLPVRWDWGSLAFIFPPRVAQDFLLDRSVCDHRWGRWQEEGGGLAGTDIVIGAWAMRKRIPIWYAVPSLVQHVGATSTLGLELQATGARRADRWAGSFICSSRR